jgi:hypothetical protein
LTATFSRNADAASPERLKAAFRSRQTNLADQQNQRSADESTLRQLQIEF